MEYIDALPANADIDDDTLTAFNSRHSVLPAYEGVGNRKASYIAAKLNADAAKLDKNRHLVAVN